MYLYRVQRIHVGMDEMYEMDRTYQKLYAKFGAGVDCVLLLELVILSSEHNYVILF